MGFTVMTLSLLHSPSFSEDANDGIWLLHSRCLSFVLFGLLSFTLETLFKVFYDFDCWPSLLTASLSMAVIVALVRAHSGFCGQVI